MYVHTVSVVVMGQSMVHSSLQSYCRNNMMMHMALRGLSTIAIDITNHTVRMFLVGRKVDDSSARGVGN